MLPRELLRKIRKIEIVTSRLVNERLAGQYHSVFKGRGMSFDEVREYQPGDDVRLIDWNVSARMNAPFIKRFVEERELTVMLLVDASRSLDFGTREQFKREVAAEVAALLAFSAIKNNDRVGLIIFTDKVEKYVPPKKGRKHVLRVIMDILTFRPEGRGTSIKEGLDFLGKITKRKAVVFLFSDFLDEAFEKPLVVTAARHDLVPVVLRDDRETSLPSVGLVHMEDPETGERYVVDTSSSRVRKAFKRQMSIVDAATDRLFKKLKLDAIELRTGTPYFQAVYNYFKIRASRF